MKVSLSQLMELDPYRNNGILLLKKELQGYKKKGVVFFQDSILTLSPTQSFQLYYSIHANETSIRGPFPIPTSEWSILCQWKKQEKGLGHLKNYFYDYYGTYVATSVLRDYLRNTPYVGEEFTWYYTNKEYQ